MDESILRLRVGIFVVIAMCILGILIFINSEGWVTQYTVYIKPFTAPGVTQGTPIRKNGILIGRVKSVTPEDESVIVEMGINENMRVYTNEKVLIGSESILGDAMIEFVPLPKSERGEEVVNDYTMPVVALKPSPLDFVESFAEDFGELSPKLVETLRGIDNASLAVANTGDEIRRVATTLQEAMDDENSDFKMLVTEVRTMSRKASVAIDNVNRIFDNLNQIVGDPELKQQFRSGIGELPKILQEIRVTIADTRETIQGFRSVTDNVNSNLTNLEQFTLALKEQGPEAVEQVKSTLENVDELITQVKTFASTFKGLENSDGTIAKLFNSPELYDIIKNILSNVEDESAKLEPLMNDLRGFGDKINRKPSDLVLPGGLGGPRKNEYKGTAGRDGGLFR